MNMLAAITITVEEDETSIYTHVSGYAHKKLDKWDRAEIVNELCHSLNITPNDVFIWSHACKMKEETEE